MRLSIFTLITTLTCVLAVPAAVPLNPISAKRSPSLAALDPRQNYCFGFGNICFTEQDCKDVGCAGCIDAPEVDPNHMICY